LGHVRARARTTYLSAFVLWAARITITLLLALPVLICSSSLATAQVDRSLKLFFTHTGERATITFKRDGKYDPRGLAQINRFLRDWRKNEPARMDPRLLDLVWEVYERSGATDYIHIVSAYRSPSTNKMLRGRSRDSGVAKNSQHTLGKAMDFYIPGIKLTKLRALAMQMQVGGVGYYPSSGSPFVHLDVGNVRAWPRMTRQELVRVFPNGKTMHLPADGRALPGYLSAVADYKRRVGQKSIEIAATAKSGDATIPEARNSTLLTAMLPNPRNRAQEALELQTGLRTDNIEAETGFVDLGLMAVPVPGIRPAEPIDEREVKTAALGPISAFTNDGDVRPLAILALPESSASIATLPIVRSEREPEEIDDGKEAFFKWALSAPGAKTGMTAPEFAPRVIAGGHVPARDTSSRSTLLR
jgi:uncharacterized protein YcbK (DUF882 family)